MGGVRRKRAGGCGYGQCREQGRGWRTSTIETPTRASCGKAMLFTARLSDIYEDIIWTQLVVRRGG